LEKLKEEIKISNYYVYRFIDQNNNIVYVGRTTNLAKRFMNHAHLTDNVKKIEYIECPTGGDMAWKEIYYINLFANEHTRNDSELYSDGVTDLYLDDKWKTYTKNINTYKLDIDRIIKNQDLITNNQLVSKIHLIHIIENEKLNSIGKDKYTLSRKWFYDKDNQKEIIQLGKHITNYFHNICKAKSLECLWTTYDEVVPLIKGKGFRKGFISLNEKASYNAIYLAFVCNLFYSSGEDSPIDEDGFALSEMLQFIWRSAIREGKDIWVYIPSIRMRNLLKQWIRNNSTSNRE
jgi:hypothetical protein